MDSWRIAVLGDGTVGKTALAVQFTHNCFVAVRYFDPPDRVDLLTLLQTYDPTIEDAYRKQLLVDNKMCHMEVIDTAGQEEYATLRDQWIRQGQGFLLVYSVTSRPTFDRIAVFLQYIIRVKQSKPICILVGNKYDKTCEREVSTEEGQLLARAFNCNFVETSAKTGHNVNHLFTSLVRALRRSEPPEEKKESRSKCFIF